MEWLAFVLVVVGFFVYQGFRTRCPYCGAHSLHPKDTEAEKKAAKHYQDMKNTGMLDTLDSAGSELGSARSKPGYANRNLKCKKCGHSFDRRSAVIWASTSNKLGDTNAINEYRKLHDKN